MPSQVKSLLLISQEILTNNIDGLSYVGNVPYCLLRPSLKKATPQQLFLIERLNPHLTPESDELWLRHMSTFKDLIDAYHQGEHQDPASWRGLYLKRYQENEKRKKIISEKVKSQYNKIQNEKAARSIKVLKGVVRGRTHDSRRFSSSNGSSGSNNNSSSSSRLFLETKKAANKTNAIYRSHVQKSYHTITTTAAATTTSSNSSNMNASYSSTVTNVSKPPSQLAKAYHSNQARYGQPTPLPRTSTYPLIPPPILPPSHSTLLGNYTSTCGNSDRIKRQKTTASSKPNLSKSPSQSSSDHPHMQTKRPAALVNYNIFNELG
ncbi:RNA polymerase II transcription factor SIII subunit A-domain-containing protein [Absidia repens]|uniref:RNA polymerase II transcription factor SIII subunit A-domain-containing protein n=1 Tax=Absidia repens TaxID=90262 RepID=A0A1X2IC34_9FUNG|nr:RNA polymerase II transcription factor SIII subunit A-domain-containing protein [Absidia repens]